MDQRSFIVGVTLGLLFMLILLIVRVKLWPAPKVHPLDAPLREIAAALRTLRSPDNGDDRARPVPAVKGPPRSPDTTRHAARLDRLLDDVKEVQTQHRELKKRLARPVDAVGRTWLGRRL